jgi:ADP-heptose:LPS heptosyltransferase
LTSEKVISFAEKKDRIINAVGLLSLKELTALIKKLSLFIGVDSGITYMADTLNIPLINISGPANMKDQRPTGEKVIIIQKSLPCIPCSHSFKSPYYCKINSRECIESVSAEEIISEAKKLFENF